jgi:peptidoglycan/LPS O-acetylase OafA/YrhL
VQYLTGIAAPLRRANWGMLHCHAIRYPCAMSGQAASERRIEALDGLRGLAILLVIPHNAGRIELPGQPDRLLHPETWLPWLFDHVLQAGWSGVQLFFVLSGFLITGILVDSKRSARYFSSFYIRRALRILPVYVFALVMVLYVLPAVTGSLPEVTENLRFQGWYWTFLANWVQPFGWEIPGLSHFWSLAIDSATSGRSRSKNSSTCSGRSWCCCCRCAHCCGSPSH